MSIFTFMKENHMNILNYIANYCNNLVQWCVDCEMKKKDCDKKHLFSDANIIIFFVANFFSVLILYTLYMLCIKMI